MHRSEKCSRTFRFGISSPNYTSPFCRDIAPQGSFRVGYDFVDPPQRIALQGRYSETTPSWYEQPQRFYATHMYTRSHRTTWISSGTKCRLVLVDIPKDSGIIRAMIPINISQRVFSWKCRRGPSRVRSTLPFSNAAKIHWSIKCVFFSHNL